MAWRSNYRLETFVALLAFGGMLLLGCGAKEEPITSKNSKYRPKGAETTATETPAEAAAPAKEEKATKPKPTEVAEKAASEETPPPSDEHGSERYPVPEGDAKALQKFLADLERRRPQGGSKNEQIEDYVFIQQSRIAGGQKLLALKLDQEAKAKVIATVQDAYVSLLQLDYPGAKEGIKAFFVQLTTDEDPILARVGRIQLWGLEITDLMTVDPVDQDAFRALVNKLLKENPDSIDAANSVVQVAMTLAQRGFKDEAAEAFEILGKTCADSKDEEVAAMAKQCLAQAKAVRSQLEPLLKALVQGDPKAEAGIIDACEKLLAGEGTTFEEVGLVRQAIGVMELLGRQEGVTKILDVLTKAFKDNKDAATVKRVEQLVENAGKRIALIGKPMVVEGALPDGSPFDFSAYEGKIVLVDFWATWCQPCIQEMPNIARAYAGYKSKGFEVIGVNLDGKIDPVRRFLDLQPLPWTTVVDGRVAAGDDLSDDFAHHALAKSSGVESIPFVVLIGKDGNVDSIHVRGVKLEKRLAELLGAPATATKKPPKNFVELPPDEPAPKNIELPKDAPEETTTPAPAEEPAKKPSEEPAKEEPAKEEPTKEEPAAADADKEKQQVRMWLRPFHQPIRLLGDLVPVHGATFCAAPAEEAAAPDAAKPEAKEEEINPYLARPDLTTKQLIDYLLKMEEKPRSIRARETFLAAVVDAADRVLKMDPPATEKQLQIALEMKLDFLHEQSMVGNEGAQKQLDVLADALKEDTREKIARRVQLLVMEKEAMAGADLPLDQVPALLEKIDTFLTKQTLSARHLRLASATVGLINRIEAAEEQDKLFDKFGKQFAKSSDKSLSKYGKKLLKSPEGGGGEQNLVGKPLELAGKTVAGVPFELSQLRGKVVVVDFWATWCGPCQREMPHLQELYTSLHDKGLEVVGVSLDEDEDALNAYLTEHQIAWETLAGSDMQETATKLGIRGIPTMLLIDREGKVVAQGHNVQSLRGPLEKLLPAKPSGG